MVTSLSLSFALCWIVTMFASWTEVDCNWCLNHYLWKNGIKQEGVTALYSPVENSTENMDSENPVARSSTVFHGVSHTRYKPFHGSRGNLQMCFMVLAPHGIFRGVIMSRHPSFIIATKPIYRLMCLEHRECSWYNIGWNWGKYATLLVQF